MNRANLFLESAAKRICHNHLLLCFCFFTSLLWCPHRSLGQSMESRCALLAVLQGGFVRAQIDPSPADKQVFTMGGSPLEDSLARSRWVSKVGEGCVDTLLLKTSGRVREYSCEVDEWYIGNFTVRGDTVIVTHLTESEDGGGKERWRLRYLYG